MLLLLGSVTGCSEDGTVATTPTTVDPAGSIGVYADDGGTDMNVIDTGGTVTLHVVHKIAAGALGSSFRIEAPEGWVLLAPQPQFAVTLGNADEGFSVGYGNCLSGAIHVMSLMYDSPGDTPANSKFKVLAHTGTPEGVETVDCNRHEWRNARGIESPVTTPDDNPAGRIGVYNDILGTNIDIIDTGGRVTLYVVHDVTNAMGASFRIEAPAGWTRTWVQNQFPVTLGNPESGVAIGFGDCLQGPIHVMTLSYMSPGNSEPGAMFRVRPHSGIPDGIETVDCTRTELRTTVGVRSPVKLGVTGGGTRGDDPTDGP
jgi:hypothetical protein